MPATHTQYAAALNHYVANGGEVAWSAYETTRVSYLAGKSAIDAGQRSAEVAQARARIEKRGY